MANENIRKQYAGGAAQTTLVGSIDADDTSFTIADPTGWPSGSTPFCVDVDPNQATEECMLVTRTGSTLTVIERAYDDTAASAHSAGANIIHNWDANSADQANRYVNLQANKGSFVIHNGVNPVEFDPEFAGDGSDDGFVLFALDAAGTGWSFGPLPAVVADENPPNVATTRYSVWYDETLHIFRSSDGSEWRLPNQALYFANVAARAAGIPSPRLGQLAQIGADIVERYDGDSWRPIGIPIFTDSAARDAYFAHASVGLYEGSPAYTADDSRLWRYRATGVDEWVSIAPKITVSDTQPADPYDGDLWFQPV